MQHKDLTSQSLIQAELNALQEEGYDTHPLLKLDQKSQTGGVDMAEFWHYIDLLKNTQAGSHEPSEYEGILAAQDYHEKNGLPKPEADALYDRILGAWQARCAGCTLGKPVEGWSRRKIKDYLLAAESYPLDGYIPAMSPFPPGLELSRNYTGTTKGNITKMVRDDDIDYTILGLKALEVHGRDFSSSDIGKLWLENLPFYQIFTAEAAAYRNLINGMEPPLTAYFQNPYREFIGAQIRADMWGYVNPGDPERAAEFAFRDASLSHTKNGIYGAMWAAACIAAAFALDDPREIIEAGLREIPSNCRLTKAILETMEWSQGTKDWEDVYQMVDAHYGHYHTVHVINNSCVITAGLMLGQGELSRTLCVTLMGGYDTDCTCATAGSIVGAMKGAVNLPEEWISPINNRITSLINEFENSQIEDLARRTLQFCT